MNAGLTTAYKLFIKRYSKKYTFTPVKSFEIILVYFFNFDTNSQKLSKTMLKQSRKLVLTSFISRFLLFSFYYDDD